MRLLPIRRSHMILSLFVRVVVADENTAVDARAALNGVFDSIDLDVRHGIRHHVPPIGIVVVGTTCRRMRRRIEIQRVGPRHGLVRRVANVVLTLVIVFVVGVIGAVDTPQRCRPTVAITRRVPRCEVGRRGHPPAPGERDVDIYRRARS